MAVGIGYCTGVALQLFCRSPLRSLTEATQRIAHSDLTKQIAVRTHDTIELLGHAFNPMVGQVCKMIAQEEQRTSKKRINSLNRPCLS